MFLPYLISFAVISCVIEMLRRCVSLRLFYFAALDRPDYWKGKRVILFKRPIKTS